MLGSNWESEKLMKFARAVWELISQAALLSDFLTISASPILVFSPVDARLSIWNEFTVSAMKVALVWAPKVRPNEAAQHLWIGLRVMAVIAVTVASTRITALSRESSPRPAPCTFGKAEWGEYWGQGSRGVVSVSWPCWSGCFYLCACFLVCTVGTWVSLPCGNTCQASA